MRPFATPLRQRGFTIVEMMVGVLIGLVATVVMFQVFAVSEGQKRTTTYAGDAQQNGVASLFQMERDARQAGYGINYLPLLGCNVLGWYEPTGTPFTFSLVPVLITNGAAGAPDTVTFTYANIDLFSQPAELTYAAPAAQNYFQVNNRYGFNEGNLIIAGEPGKNCSLSQVRVLPTPTNADRVQHDSGGYTDDAGRAQVTLYNKPGGLGVDYNAWAPGSNTGGHLYDIGALPTVMSYSVVNNQLVATNNLVPADVQVISDGIVQMQVQYGYDGNADGRVPSDAVINATLVANGPDQWADTMPVGAVAATEWQKVIAVRLVVVSRSANPEKVNPVSGVCDATSVSPTWQATGRAIDLSANPNWKCYRYRLFEVVVPLRNMVWFAQPS